MNISDYRAPQFYDEEIAAIFSDEHEVGLMLQIEAALARVQAQLGVIPAEAGQTISAAAEQLVVDYAALREGVEKSGVPVSALVNQLRGQAGAAGDYVHYGATTQDVMDTATVLQLRAVLNVLETRMQQICRNLGALADTHRHTLMVGRTHTQQALPTTFGLKVAYWLAPLIRHQTRLSEFSPRLLVVQFGGAVGNLAALGSSGIDVRAGLAAELGLGVPLATWHTARDCIAEVGHWCVLLSGLLAKIAQDILLMAQTEIGELAESGDLARGGSSTMPQKQNPVKSEAILAIAQTNTALLSALQQAVVQEHERGTHGWQVEWLTLPQIVQLTGASLTHALFLSQHLKVNVAQMQANVKAANGLIMAEALRLALIPALGAKAAQDLVKKAVQISKQEGQHLVDVVAQLTEAPLDLARLKDESRYCGPVDDLIDQILYAIEK